MESAGSLAGGVPQRGRDGLEAFFAALAREESQDLDSRPLRRVAWGEALVDGMAAVDLERAILVDGLADGWDRGEWA